MKKDMSSSKDVDTTYDFYSLFTSVLQLPAPLAQYLEETIESRQQYGSDQLAALCQQQLYEYIPFDNRAEHLSAEIDRAGDVPIKGFELERHHVYDAEVNRYLPWDVIAEGNTPPPAVDLDIRYNSKTDMLFLYMEQQNALGYVMPLDPLIKDTVPSEDTVALTSRHYIIPITYGHQEQESTEVSTVVTGLYGGELAVSAYGKSPVAPSAIHAPELSYLYNAGRLNAFGKASAVSIDVLTGTLDLGAKSRREAYALYQHHPAQNLESASKLLVDLIAMREEGGYSVEEEALQLYQDFAERYTQLTHDNAFVPDAGATAVRHIVASIMDSRQHHKRQPDTTYVRRLRHAYNCLVAPDRWYTAAAAEIDVDTAQQVWVVAQEMQSQTEWRSLLASQAPYTSDLAFNSLLYR